MKSIEAEHALRRLIGDRGLAIERLNARVAIELMVSFYRDHRVEDCDMKADGDMLLFEWGVYPWGGESFRIEITRQFILSQEDEGHISQWALGVHFDPDAEVRDIFKQARELKITNQWCSSPDDIPEFERFIESSVALPLADSRIITKVTLELRNVG